jgi:plasmid stability protein
MTTITLDLMPDTYQRLLTRAQQHGAPVEAMAEQLLTAQLADCQQHDQPLFPYLVGAITAH